MSPFWQEWLNLLFRVAHVVAGIMWIGDSFLFMWLDSHLSTPVTKREGAVVGELWMTHSGGFYEVVKRKSLAPNEMPATLYWFKWESYSTWITGFFLITVVYYLGGPAMLVGADSPLSHPQAVALSLGLLLGGVILYHLICATPLIQYTRVMGVLGLVAFCGLVWALGHVFTSRAVFLQVGAMMGSIMSSNVLLRIIPAQMHMVGATRAGQPVDTSYGLRAKQRSVHNHYMTFPVLFTMVSNHLPGLYGHAASWLVLGMVFIFAVGIKYALNHRERTHPIILLGTAAALAGVVGLTKPAPVAAEAYADIPTVHYATVEQILLNRCVTCHAAQPANASFASPPSGIMLETPQQVKMHAERVLVRAVQTHTMPLGNTTGMTEQERRWLGAWVSQGANTEAKGPVQLTVAAAPKAEPVAAGGTPADEAKALFSGRCAVCHGAQGAGDGAGAAALNPKPRNFKDAQWQSSVTDQHLTQVIVGGGPAVGKNAMMPANPDLKDKPEVLAELVKLIRALR